MKHLRSWRVWLEFAIVTLVVLWLACDVFAQCGPGGCGVSGRQATFYQGAYLQCGPNGCSLINPGQQNTVAATYKWVKIPGYPQHALYLGNEQVGAYNYEAKIYRTFRAPSQWGDVTEPPTPPPAQPETGKKQVSVTEIPGCTLDEDGKPNFGVMPDPTEAKDATPRYQVNGKEATKNDVLQAFEDKAVDQSGKLHLTVIGPKQVRQVVLEDLKRTPDLAAVVKNFLLKDYGPDDWEVARSGFYTKGSPTIYVQAPSGKVLHRQDSYTGAEDLVSVLRKANDQYKAEADPNLSKAAILGLFGIPLEAWIVIGVVLFFVIPRKDNSQ